MDHWPQLDPARDHSTLGVLHLAAQMLGKIRVAHAPWSNHGWHVALQPVAQGLAILPTNAGDGRTFTLTLDLCAHGLALRASDGSRDQVTFADEMYIAEIHGALMAMLEAHGLPSAFNGRPNEIEGAAPFSKDVAPRRYDRRSAEAFRQSLAAMLPVFERFRAGFLGKASPVHFWWGSFDLAVTRFSGRKAPTHPGGVPGLPDRVTREAYSHEVSSAGFWASGAVQAEPFFYSYAYPEPDGFRTEAIAHGSFDDTFGEFILPYAKVQAAPDPERMLAEFLQSSYEAAARLASWDRTALEREPVAP